MCSWHFPQTLPLTDKHFWEFDMFLFLKSGLTLINSLPLSKFLCLKMSEQRLTSQPIKNGTSVLFFFESHFISRSKNHWAQIESYIHRPTTLELCNSVCIQSTYTTVLMNAMNLIFYLYIWNLNQFWLLYQSQLVITYFVVQ